MSASPEALLRQAQITADQYMCAGSAAIAQLFDVGEGTAAHVDLCKALLPAFMKACSDDFALGMRVVYPKGLS